MLHTFDTRSNNLQEDKECRYGTYAICTWEGETILNEVSTNTADDPSETVGNANKRHLHRLPLGGFCRIEGRVVGSKESLGDRSDVVNV